MIDVARDGEGLRQAALELMEEAMDAPERERLERLAAMAKNSEAVLRDIPERRTLSPGYYMWITYVVEAIVGPMESGVAFREADLRVEEVLGLTALREARMRFRKEHPPCRDCGKALPNAGVKQCAECETADFQNRRR